jgi:hypothetical protein
MLIEAMATHEALKKKFFESNLKRKHNIAFFKYIWFWVKM